MLTLSRSPIMIHFFVARLKMYTRLSSNNAKHPLSHNVPMDIKACLMSGKRFACLASGGNEVMGKRAVCDE